MRRPETAYSAKTSKGLAWDLAPKLALWLAAAAAFLMAASTVHASGHDHDHEHDADHDAECVVCIVASLNAGKLAPAEPSLFQSPDYGEAAPVREAGAFFAFFLSTRNARGPPLLSSRI